MDDPLDDAWTALRTALEIRCRELNEVVRTYPTPIARCDEQLTKALEERDAAFRHLRRASSLDESRSIAARAEWRSRIGEFAAGLEMLDDDSLATARGRLISALASG